MFEDAESKENHCVEVASGLAVFRDPGSEVDIN
jgi:hypothetical protein